MKVRICIETAQFVINSALEEIIDAFQDCNIKRIIKTLERKKEKA